MVFVGQCSLGFHPRHGSRSIGKRPAIAKTPSWLGRSAIGIALQVEAGPHLGKIPKLRVAEPAEGSAAAPTEFPAH